MCANYLSFYFFSENVYFFHLHQDIGSDIHYNIANLFGGPHFMTDFDHSENLGLVFLGLRIGDLGYRIEEN